ncbi:MAG TPA: helix-turn-helix transcriptional regulator [Candidatus Blautia gallistercoris]|uniref:Helix-turn-helix transcriptional regulator n=1 Tax=Candidatus Blautia gallistercoris TaxID=2838490 RepID=A0A9D1WIH2_9FIRM|nr:helix-turn-helix transcriptional regulator [Candidatus Blautia gallistercoris]
MNRLLRLDLYVARILHVSQRTYADYELGNVRIPLEYMIRLAELYDVNMDYICCLSEEKKSFPLK